MRFALLFLVGCAATRPLAVVAVNDVYRIASPPESPEGGLARVASLARELSATHDVIVTLAGDFVSPALETTFVSKGRHMTEALDAVEGTTEDAVHMVATLGNHEYDLKPPDFCAAFKGNRFTTVAADSALFPPCLETPFPRWVSRELGGQRVCITGTLGKLTPGMGAPALEPDALLSSRPEGCDLVLVLTHQDMADDVALSRSLRAIPGLPRTVILGGHEHSGLVDVSAEPWVLKAPSDARRAFVLEFSDGAVRLSDVVLSGAVPPEAPDVVAVGKAWRDKALAARNIDPAIWSQVLWPALPVAIEGEETALRGRETTLGNLVADALRQLEGAEHAAVVNTGSLRLGRDIPAGADLTVGHLLETDLFEAEIVAVAGVTAAELLAIGKDSLIGWPGQGRFPALSANLTLDAAGIRGAGAAVTLLTTSYMCTNPKGAAENPALHAVCKARPDSVRRVGVLRELVQRCLSTEACREAVGRDLTTRRIDLRAPSPTSPASAPQP